MSRTYGGSGRLIGDAGNVRVVGADVHSWGVPLERDVSASLCERWLLGVDSGLRVLGGKRQVVGDIQVGEDLPSDSRVVIGASDDELREGGPTGMSVSFPTRFFNIGIMG